MEREYDWQILADRLDEIWTRAVRSDSGIGPRRDREVGEHTRV